MRGFDWGKYIIGWISDQVRNGKEMDFGFSFEWQLGSRSSKYLRYDNYITIKLCT